jgi:hypothetical protein
MIRTPLVATVTLAFVGAACWALQAVALDRPSRAQLELVRTLRSLDGLHGSWGTVELGGRTYRAQCTQRWHGNVHVAQVALDGIDTVTEVGNQLVGPKGPMPNDEFDLAGCPRPLVDWLAGELVRGASVDVRTIEHDGQRLTEVRFAPRSLPLEIYVAGSRELPVGLRLSSAGVRGTSVLHYGMLH